MTDVLLVGVGGFVGAVLRYAVGGLVQAASRSSALPYGTLFVNVSGCLAIGLLSQLADTRAMFTLEVRLLLFAGVLGAYTTFSTFGNDTLRLFHADAYLLALANIGAQLGLGLGAVWLGRSAAAWLWH